MRASAEFADIIISGAQLLCWDLVSALLLWMAHVCRGEPINGLAAGPISKKSKRR